jgi:hypothetical protein
MLNPHYQRRRTEALKNFLGNKMETIALNATNATNTTFKRSFRIHYIIIIYGLFLIVQDLITVNLESFPVLFRILKSADEAASIILFSLLFLYHLYLHWSIKKSEIDLILICLVLIALGSSFIQGTPLNILGSQFLLYIKGFLFFYVFIYLPVTIRIMKTYRRIFFWAGIVLFFLGMIDLAAPAQFRSFIGTSPFVEYRYNIPSIKSLFSHPAIFGWFMNFLALYCFASFIVFKKGTYLVLGLIFFSGSFLSMRLKAIIGLFASIWMGIVIYPLGKGKRVVVLIFLILMVIIIIFLGSPISDLLEAKYKMYVTAETSMEIARNALAIKSIDVAKDKFPFGAGLGRYGSWISRIHYSPIYYQYGLSHVWGLSEDFPVFINDTFWPMILGETGVFGFILFVAVLIIFLVVLFKNTRTQENPYAKAYFLGTFMILIESIFESIAAPVYVQPPYAFFIFGAVGTAFSLRNFAEQ